jgi:aminotransferase
MSKSYAMTGWRIGYVSAPKAFTEAMYKIHQYLIMSAPTMGQAAALEAIRSGEDDVERMRQEYDARRRLLVDGFNRLSMRCFEPRGAFYAFPSIAISGMDDESFCATLLDEERLALIPGSAFGDSGRGYVRASYATSEDNIREALRRLERFLARRGLLQPVTEPALAS